MKTHVTNCLGLDSPLKYQSRKVRWRSSRSWRPQVWAWNQNRKRKTGYGRSNA